MNKQFCDICNLIIEDGEMFEFPTEVQLIPRKIIVHIESNGDKGVNDTLPKTHFHKKCVVEKIKLIVLKQKLPRINNDEN